MSTQESSWSRREFARILFRYRIRGALVFCGIVTAVVVGLVVCPREYNSEARLFVRLGRESVTIDPTATASGQVVALNATRESEIISVMEVLRSRTNVEKVLDRVGPEKPITTAIERDRAISRLQKDIGIWCPRNSSVIVLEAEAGSPQRAQQILEALIDVSLEAHARVNRNPDSYEFFDEQARLLKEQLDRATEQLRDAKNEYGLVTLEGRRQALEQQLSGIKVLARENDAALAASEAKLADLKRSLANLPSPLVQQLIAGVPSGAQANMRQKLYELQTREQELLSKLTAEHPEVIAIRRQVREAERILASETPKHAESQLAALANEQANAASLRARAASLATQLDELESELKQLNEQELRITELERKVRLLDANYVNYVTGLEQSRIDQALNADGITNINIIQPPTFVAKPSRPRVGLTLALGCVVALVGSLGVVLLSEHLDQSLKSPADVERSLDLPVLASIPRLGHPGIFEVAGPSSERHLAHV